MHEALDVRMPRLGDRRVAVRERNMGRCSAKEVTDTFVRRASSPDGLDMFKTRRMLDEWDPIHSPHNMTLMLSNYSMQGWTGFV